MPKCFKCKSIYNEDNHTCLTREEDANWSRLVSEAAECGMGEIDEIEQFYVTEDGYKPRSKPLWYMGD